MYATGSSVGGQDACPVFVQEKQFKVIEATEASSKVKGKGSTYLQVKSDESVSVSCVREKWEVRRAVDVFMKELCTRSVLWPNRQAREANAACIKEQSQRKRTNAPWVNLDEKGRWTGYAR